MSITAIRPIRVSQGHAVARSARLHERLPAVVEPPAVELPAEPVTAGTAALDVVEAWGLDSFPASDPPSNW